MIITNNQIPISADGNLIMQQPLKVTVVMGGPSGEHDISLKSGHGVTEALSRGRWRVDPLVIPRELDVEGARRWTQQALTASHPDVVFIALHGTFGEDGTIQQLCEEQHLAYTGSDALASRLGMDKVASRRRFEAAGLCVPRWGVVEIGRGSVRLPAGITYPIVVKPISEGSSLGVSMVGCSEQLAQALAEASRYGARILVEEFIRGRELTVGMLADAALPVIEIRPTHPFFDFTAKYTLGSTDYLVPAPIDAQTAGIAQAAARTAHVALGCRHLSRTDLILSEDGRMVVLEINTIPGFTPTSLLPKAAACIGLSYDAVCEQLVLMAARELVAHG